MTTTPKADGPSRAFPAHRPCATEQRHWSRLLVQRGESDDQVSGSGDPTPRIDHQGSRGASRNTTACGTPGESGDSDLSDALPLPTTASASGPRVHRAPGVPHALSISRAGMQHPSDAHATREGGRVSAQDHISRFGLFENSALKSRKAYQRFLPSYAGLTRVSINRHEKHGSPGHRSRRRALARR